jgi:DHA1 family multidrug resistance protein-like MFS transporter
METIRDSAFGKLVRFLRGYRLFQCPEEMDGLTWRKYLQTPDAYQDEAMTETSSEGFYEQNALYTVMSQCTRREKPPLKSVLAGPWRGIHD